MRYYDALGLEPKLALEAEELKKRFYERSRQWHPDRFSRAAASEQAKALDMTAVLNDAFRTLRDPVARADYFLEQHGIHPSKTPPPELLEEVFELNMALEELRGGDDSVRPQLEQARERFTAMRGEIDARLSALFARYDDSGDKALLDEIRGVLDRRRYISNLIRDVEREAMAKESTAHEAAFEETDVHFSN
jgi:molecular chaperone HscB